LNEISTEQESRMPRWTTLARWGAAAVAVVATASHAQAPFEIKGFKLGMPRDEAIGVAQRLSEDIAESVRAELSAQAREGVRYETSARPDMASARASRDSTEAVGFTLRCTQFREVAPPPGRLVLGRSEQTSSCSKFGASGTALQLGFKDDALASVHFFAPFINSPKGFNAKGLWPAELAAAFRKTFGIDMKLTSQNQREQVVASLSADGRSATRGVQKIAEETWSWQDPASATYLSLDRRYDSFAKVHTFSIALTRPPAAPPPKPEPKLR
jgi:hypothetical protein